MCSFCLSFFLWCTDAPSSISDKFSARKERKKETKKERKKESEKRKAKSKKLQKKKMFHPPGTLFLHHPHGGPSSSSPFILSVGKDHFRDFYEATLTPEKTLVRNAAGMMVAAPPAWLQPISDLWQDMMMMRDEEEDDADDQDDQEDQEESGSDDDASTTTTSNNDKDDGDNDDGDNNNNDATTTAISRPLPTCDSPYCTDLALLYDVLGAWCVPWKNVPKTPFVTYWFARDVAERRALLQSRHCYFEELDEKAWLERMLQRDDADMFVALPESVRAELLKLNWSMASIPLFLGGDARTQMVRFGARHILGYWIHLQTKGSIWTPDLQNRLCAEAAERGDLAMLEMLYRYQVEARSTQLWEAAVRGCHLPCIQFAVKVGAPRSHPPFFGWCTAAAKAGSLECLAYLHEEIGCPFETRYSDSSLGRKYNVCLAAAEAGSLACLKYVVERGGRLLDPRTLCLAAVDAGAADCLDYIVRELNRGGVPAPWSATATLPTTTTTTTPKKKKLSKKADHGDDWCMRAVRAKSMECLRVLHAHGCPWDRRVCSGAARSGLFDCLRFARENGCPWDGAVCVSSAERGFLDCLRYAHENGCAWGRSTCAAAAEKGHLDCLKYAFENGCAVPPQDQARMCLLAAKGGYLACLEYAYAVMGCKWAGGECLAAIKVDSLPCLQYARAHGCPWGKYAECKRAAEHFAKPYDAVLLRWLKDTRAKEIAADASAAEDDAKDDDDA